MATSFDVSLPRTASPKFPDRCPCSGGPTNGKAVRLSFVGYNRSPSLVDHVLDINTASNNSIDYALVPASEDCARRLRRYHFWIKVLKFGAWIPLLAAAILLNAPTFVIVIAALGGLIGPVVWELFNPPAVGATPMAEAINWEFADRAYAEEFARLNNGKVG